MATYIVLFNETQQGMEKIKEWPARYDAARKALSDMGVELKQSYLVMGRYDFVAVVEAPNDEAVAKVALGIASQGNVRTETLRAFTEDEFRKIIASLP